LLGTTEVDLTAACAETAPAISAQLFYLSAPRHPAAALLPDERLPVSIPVRALKIVDRVRSRPLTV